MKATFFEYNVAMSGIFTARANLNVIGHNIANSAIPGYSRQQTIQHAGTPLTLRDGKGMYGTGSVVMGVKQIRDKFLDNKYWQHHGVQGEYTSKSNNLSLIETVFNDLPGSGVLSSFRDFFDTLQDLSTTTPDATYRANVINMSKTLTSLVRTNAEALQKHQRDINAEVENTVTLINSLGTQIASLNRQIHDYERDGSIANDLRDQRTRLVDDLSQFVNVEGAERDFSTPSIPYDTRYSVLINGSQFVDHDMTHTLMCVPRKPSQGNVTQSGRLIEGKEKRNEMDVPGLFDIFYTTTGAEFNIYSVTLKGSLKGLIDVRDGNNGLYTEPKEAFFLTGTAGTYTSGTGVTGSTVYDVLDFINGLEAGGVLISPDHTGTIAGTQGLIDRLATMINEVDMTRPNALRDLQSLANDLFDVVANADYSAKEVMEMVKPVLSDAQYDALVSANIPDNYNQLLSEALNALKHASSQTDATKARDELQQVLAQLKPAGGGGLYSIYSSGFNTRVTTAVNAIPAAERTIVTEKAGLPPSSERVYTTTLYKGIPFYMNKLNTLVRTFARSFNEGLDFKLQNIPKNTDGNVVGHMYGYDYNGENNSLLMFTSSNGVTSGNNAADFGGLSMWRCEYTLNGVTFNETLTSSNDTGPDLPPGAVISDCERVYMWQTTSVKNDGSTLHNIVLANEDFAAQNPSLSPAILSETTVDYSGLNAFNFCVNPELEKDSFLLACSSDPNTGESSNDVTLGFGKIGEYNSLFREGKLLDFIIGTSDHLAIDKMQALNFEESYDEILLMTDNQRIAIAGVDTNEEITNMIKYNQLFVACSQLVNTINQVYNTLINDLGRM
jgi:flagellar hook-associated protein FlgK